jgi:hypothetical protein
LSDENVELEPYPHYRLMEWAHEIQNKPSEGSGYGGHQRLPSYGGRSVKAFGVGRRSVELIPLGGGASQAVIRSISIWALTPPWVGAVKRGVRTWWNRSKSWF